MNEKLSMQIRHLEFDSSSYKSIKEDFRTKSDQLNRLTVNFETLSNLNLFFSEIQSLHQKLVEVQIQNGKLERENEDLRDTVEKLQIQKQKVKGQNLEHQNALSKAKSCSLHFTLNLVKMIKNVFFKVEFDELFQMSSLQNSDLQNLTSKFDTLHQETEKCKETNRDLKNQVYTLDQEKHDLLNKLESLHRDFDQLSREKSINDEKNDQVFRKFRFLQYT